MLSVDIFASQLSSPNVRVWNLVIFISPLTRQGSCPWFLCFNLVEALSHLNYFNALLYLPVQAVTGVLFLYCYNLFIKATFLVMNNCRGIFHTNVVDFCLHQDIVLGSMLSC